MTKKQPTEWELTEQERDQLEVLAYEVTILEETALKAARRRRDWWAALIVRLKLSPAQADRLRADFATGKVGLKE